jgi:hypothetical protein
VVTTIDINHKPSFKDQSSNTTECKTVGDTSIPNNIFKCIIIISIKHKIKISNNITINTKTREATMVDITKIKIKTIKVEEIFSNNNKKISPVIKNHKLNTTVMAEDSKIYINRKKTLMIFKLHQIFRCSLQLNMMPER